MISNVGSTEAQEAQNPGVQARIGLFFFKKFIGQWKQSILELELPNGVIMQLGEGQDYCKMQILRWDFFQKILWSGDVAFGESFVDGDWDSPDMVHLLSQFVINQKHADDHNAAFSIIGSTFSWIKHKLNQNSMKGSKKNISFHYDLSNDLYKKFLDPKMQYSCAYWKSADESLDEAQINKMDAILEKMNIQEDMRVLEIGSGWGELAIRAVQKYNCSVTSVTLSKQQLKEAKHRAKKLGLQDQITFLYKDYRDLEGKYDRIMSVEMIEAVGHENLPVYFAKIESLLKANGIAVVQAITIPDFKYEQYRKTSDWIQQYIFPGAVCPSFSAISTAVAENTRLLIHDVHNIGFHYAQTLRVWRKKFLNQWYDIRQLGFDDRFKNTWLYYLMYCEAGFITRNLGTLQFTLTNTNNHDVVDR